VQKQTKREAAIKIISKKALTVPEYEQVHTEIEILKICNHPNIIKLYDILENQDYIYIITEVCKGSDMFDYLSDRKFKIPECRAAKFINKIARAIYYLHSYGIVHRDLKPENILMTDASEDADLKILDFGLSKIIGPDEKCTEPFGTLHYVSPELLLGMAYDKKVDIWSLGIISYLLITGHLPFNDENESEVARQIINEPVPFPKLIWKSKSYEAKLFVSSLLQKEPSSRANIKDIINNKWLLSTTSSTSCSENFDDFECDETSHKKKLSFGVYSIPK